MRPLLLNHRYSAAEAGLGVAALILGVWLLWPETTPEVDHRGAWQERMNAAAGGSGDERPVRAGAPTDPAPVRANTSPPSGDRAAARVATVGVPLSPADRTAGDSAATFRLPAGGDRPDRARTGDEAGTAVLARRRQDGPGDRRQAAGARSPSPSGWLVASPLPSDDWTNPLPAARPIPGTAAPASALTAPPSATAELALKNLMNREQAAAGYGLLGKIGDPLFPVELAARGDPLADGNADAAAVPSVDLARLADRPEAALPPASGRNGGAMEEDSAFGPWAPAGRPAWLRNAVAYDLTDNRPLIAVVIDDLGLNRKNTARLNELPGPLTLAFLPYAGALERQTRAARVAGHELMLHMPMEPFGTDWPGPDALMSDLDDSAFKARLQKNLASFEGFVGINNHMGSKVTADRHRMTMVMEALRERGELFLDSRTSSQSVALESARLAGVPNTVRDVFLDHVIELQAIRDQLALLERVARRTGGAIAIGHPHDATIEALQAWLPEVEKRGFALVPISVMVARRACNDGLAVPAETCGRYLQAQSGAEPFGRVN
jgi:polysaccharide deacetylase 2 family uncharacterized protein YibQ